MASGKDILSIGDRIKIVKSGSKGEKSYSSQVLDIIDEETFIINGPIYKNKLVMVYRGEKVRISYIVENKGRYVFDAIVLKREYKNIYSLKLQKVSDIKRYQQRRFYRLDISVPVAKEFCTKEENTIEECRAKDISGSGLKLYSNTNHSIGDIIKCKFQVDKHNIEIGGKIIRVEKIDTFDYKYSLGIDFIDIDDKQRDKIIKFIFEKERILREKELI